MDPGPGVIRVVHPYLADVEKDGDDELTLLKYLESEARSGGGTIDETELVKDDAGRTTVIYIQFLDPQCAERVCAKSHYLGVVFLTKQIERALMDSKLDVQLHDGSLSDIPQESIDDMPTPLSEYADSSAAGDESLTSSLAAEDVKTASIVVYEFPEDVEISELTVYFQEEHNGHVKASRYDEEENSYILEFPDHEIDKILEQEEHLLDEDDKDSIIKIRRLEKPIRDVLMTSKSAMNARMIKRALKSFGEMEKCTQLADKLKFVVTFSTVEGAKEVASRHTLQLTDSIKVRVELYDVSDSSDPLSAELPSNTPPSNTVKDAQARSINRSSPGPGMKSYSGFPSPFKPNHGSTPSASFDAGVTSPRFSTLNATHVEIDKLPDDSVLDMYQMLTLHLQDLFGEQVPLTVFAQSYDPSQGMFRFDFKSEEIEKLMSERQLLLEGDDATAVTIRPKTTGNVVEVNVVDNPRKVRLGKSSLYKCFGQKSGFSAKLIIHGPNLNKANLQMESFSVAAKIVQMERHTLDNKIVLKASFSTEKLPTPDPAEMESEPTANIVLASTAISKTILQKYIKSRTNGIIIEQLGGGKFLVEYETDEAARKVVNQKVIDFNGAKINVSLHAAAEETASKKEVVDTPESDDGELSDDQREDAGTSKKGQQEFTHVVVEPPQMTGSSPQDTYSKFVAYFSRVLGHKPHTTYVQSFDTVARVFRFDFSPSDIKKLLLSPHQLDSKNKKTKFTMTPASTGTKVCLLSPSKKLSKKAITTTFGPSSTFKSEVTVDRCGQAEAELTFTSCSVAAKFVSHEQHELLDGHQVNLSFIEDQSDSESESDNDDGAGDRKGAGASSKVPPIPTPRGAADSSRSSPRQRMGFPLSGSKGGADTSGMCKVRLDNSSSSSPATADSLSTKTLVVSNLLDVHQQTIYFWIKSLLNVWPLSIQFSVDEERAIVKVPVHCHIDNDKLREAVGIPGFYLRGEKLTVQELPSITNIQVTCTNQQASNTLDPFTLESYFSNPKYTGVKDHSAVVNVQPLTPYNNLPVFVVSYGSAEDVECVLKRSSYQLSKWSLAVAGFYPEVGMCNPDSLRTYPAERNHSKEKGDKKKQPILHINNIDEGKIDIDTLELLMSHRRRSDGGEIESWKRFPGKTTGMASVQVIYKESGVAERVYELYKRNGLTSHGINLELELELPWLGPDHDDRKVRVSGLNDDLDPEELKFYLSALSENVVTEMFFNKSQTRAVAMFKDPIDYGRLIDQHHSISMKDFAQLKIQQEYKIKDLIATGDKLTKEDIELPLENLLHSKFNRDVDVHADKLTDSVDMWKITTEPDALQYILKQKHRITRCETLAPYSVFLGLHVTSGVHKKSQNMDNFVSDQLMLHFLLNVQSGLQKLAGFLQTLGMILAKDGGITINQVATTKNDRTVLKNWRKLKPTVEKFVEESFATYKTEPLTQQVFDRLSPEMPKLTKGQPVVTDMNAGSQPSANTGNQIRIAGEKGVVMTLAKQLEEMIKKFQAQIQEEKTVTRVTVPNINEYQIQYLEMIGFFKTMIDTHKLKSFDGDVSKQNVTIHGRPTSIDAVQKEMFDFLPKVTNSKVSVKKKPLFLNVFKTKSAEQTIKQQLKIKKISAIWYLENKTISVYSGSKADSQSALDVIDSVVWESQYPAEGKLDHLEMKLVHSDVWDAKKAEMQKLYQPLEVIEMEDHSTVGLSGLMQVKAVVIENMKMFFTQNVKRPGKFEGIPDRVLFLRKYKNHLFKDLEKAHNVEIDSSGDKAIIPMIGTTDDVANCCRSLKRQHDAICKDLMALEHQAMIRHVEVEPEFLDNIGLKTSCLVVEHKDEQAVPTTPDDSNAEVGNRFSVTLPSGTICEVRRDDITVLGGDAIVNAANGDLQHVGGLALAVVKKGGNRIQQECADHIRRNGALMEGQAFTSTAGRLNCKKVIHAVGPKWRGGQFQEERKLLMCIDNCFEEADKNKFKSIAIPPVGTGIFEYPLEKAVKAIVDAVDDREKQGDYLPEYITFVDNKEDSLKLFAEYLEQLFPSTKPDMIPVPLPRQQQQGEPKYTFIDDSDILVILNRINLEIRKGDIVETEDDVLVNSVGRSMDLNSGKVSRVISTKAGAQLQKECTSLGPLQVGEVKETAGYDMVCKSILHCLCPQSFGGPATIQTLKQIVVTCLTMAANGGHHSITFPALGTGVLRYPVEEVSKAMIEAVMEYVEFNPSTSINDVKIVIYHLDKKTVEGFNEELKRLRQMAPSTAAKPIAAGRKHILQTMKAPAFRPGQAPVGKKVTEQLEQAGSKIMNDTRINVLQGDICGHQTMVFVNSTDDRLQMQNPVSKALMAKAGQLVREEVRSLSSERPMDGMWISNAGELNAKYIFHAKMKAYYGAPKQLYALISNCLKTCDERKLGSISFPVFSKEEVGISSKNMAKVFFQAVGDYFSNNPKSLLKNVDVVVLQPYKVKHYLHYLNKPLEKKETFWTKFTNFISGGTVDDAADDDGDISDSASDSEPTEKKVLNLDIYGNTPADIAQCRNELTSKLQKQLHTMIWSEKPSYYEDREFIQKLSAIQVAKLQRAADKLGVKLEVDQRLWNIKIVGLSKDVYAMSETISNVFKVIQKEENDVQQQMLLAKAVQWTYGDERGQWINFTPAVNKALEDAYFADPKANFECSTDTGTVALDLGEMTGVDGAGLIFKIERSLPSSQGHVKWPSTWTGSVETFGDYPLVMGSPEYNEVEEKFKESVGAKGNEVISISRIQNPTLYQQYVILRKMVAKRLNKPEDEVETVPLWHGTTEEAVTKIVGDKFDRSLTGKNAAMFGLGSYFAKNSSTSATDVYSTPNAAGEKYIIQARVITGEWCQGHKEMKTPDYNGQNEQYDCAVDAVDKPTIFVVFRDAAAYPEYIVKFK